MITIRKKDVCWPCSLPVSPAASFSLIAQIVMSYRIIWLRDGQMGIKISREQLKVFEIEMIFFSYALVRGGEDSFFICCINMTLVRCDIPLRTIALLYNLHFTMDFI